MSDPRMYDTSVFTNMAASPRSEFSMSSSSPSSSRADQLNTRFHRRNISSFSNDLLSGDRDRSGEDDADVELDEDEDVDGGNASAFTNPSWYGSPFAARRDSHFEMGALSNSSPSDCEKGKGVDVDARLSAYQKGLNLARRALLEMDSELDEEYTSNQSISRRGGKQRIVDQRMQSAGTDILASFDECPQYLCASCGTTLALQDELISKAFSGRDGKAYLFFSILNIRSGQKEDRQLLTGLHTVADLSCATCQRSVGWSYIRAFEASQRYKEGKFILERASLHKTNQWHLDPDEDEIQDGMEALPW